MKIDIYKDGISFVTDEVSSVKVEEANLNEENRIKWVTDLAAVSRGKNESSNPEVRYKQLMEEAALKTPSRPMEFLPVVLKLKDNLDGTFSLFSTKDEEIHKFLHLSILQYLIKYSYLELLEGDIYLVFTNMRALLNFGVEYENIPYATEDDTLLYENFLAVKAKIPMFVFNHYVTHTQLSKESVSNRIIEHSNEYWLPNDLNDRLHSYKVGKTSDATEIAIQILKGMNKREAIVNKLLNYGQIQVQKIFKTLGYKLEIYQRAMLEFRYKTTIATGWLNNPHTWKHFMLEREAFPEDHKSWVQPETREFAVSIRKLLEKRNEKK